jgi:hypothetical protein
MTDEIKEAPQKVEGQRVIEQQETAKAPPARAAKRGPDIDWTTGVPVRAFEPVGTVVKYVPPGSPSGTTPYMIESDLSQVSPEDLEQYERDLSDARLRSKRIQYLKGELANCKDIGNPDDLESEPGDDDAQRLRQEIKEWEARPDSMNININSILMPTGIRWNVTDPPPDSTPIPLDPVEIRNRVSLQIVTGLSSNVVKAINGDTSVIVGKKELARYATKRK